MTYNINLEGQQLLRSAFCSTFRFGKKYHILELFLSYDGVVISFDGVSFSIINHLKFIIDKVKLMERSKSVYIPIRTLNLVCFLQGHWLNLCWSTPVFVNIQQRCINIAEYLYAKQEHGILTPCSMSQCDCSFHKCFFLSWWILAIFQII